MTPSEIGERAEAAVLAALVGIGKQVLLPFGERRYDLAYEENGRLVKVQCKAGSVRKGAVCFRTHSVGRSTVRDYREDVDFFGVYCHGREEVYLVPVGDVPLRRASLRLTPARNGQTSGVRMAGRYLLRNGEVR
ncbi:MAG: group I intron-associated PD-(D/E)XK endonuclease [Actinomycetota bacterium]